MVAGMSQVCRCVQVLGLAFWDLTDPRPCTAWRRALNNAFRPPRVLHDWNYDLREVEVCRRVLWYIMYTC